MTPPDPKTPAGEALSDARARTHNIKCWPDVFEEMRAGRKAAEFRYNDRGYRVGDMLLIREWDTATGAYTHREITRQITHVLDAGFGMPAGYAMLSLATPPATDAPASAKDKAVAAMRAYVESAGVPSTEFDPEFVTRMMAAMMVSFHKYGRVADAYPLKFSAADDVRARMAKYRTTGNKHFLVDAANFAMIEAMHPGRKDGAEWASNDAADSPGRTTSSGHRLVQETNDGTRIMGETILHIPGDEA